MRPITPYWFLLQEPLTNITSLTRSLSFSDVTYSSESELDYRNIELLPPSKGLPYSITFSNYQQPGKISNPILLSSGLGLQSTIGISTTVLNKQGTQESRTVQFLSSPFLKTLTQTVHYSSDVDYLTIHLPNEPGSYSISPITQTFLIPNYKYGALAIDSLFTATRSLQSAAWGLITACALNESALVISQLRELIRITATFSQLSNSTGQLLATTSDYWGLPSVTVGDTTTTIPVFDNALLGYAIARSLHYLIEEQYLNNWMGTFLSDCIELLKVFSYCTANAVNRVNGWCSSTHTDGYYDFFSLSIDTSYVASLLFNAFLQLSYDDLIHLKAAKLFLALNNAPSNITDSFYEMFIETNQRDILSYRLWWISQFRPDDVTSEFTTNWDITYTGIEAFAPSTYDFLASAIGIPICGTSNLSNVVTNTIFTAVNQPVAQLEAARYLFIEQLACLCVMYNQFKLSVSGVFNTFANEAQAYTALSRTEIMRMFPQGNNYSTSEILADRTTILGGLTYAYGQSQFVWFMRFCLVRLPLLSSSGFLLRELLKQVLSVAVNLPEDTARSILATLFNNSTLSVQQQLSAIYQFPFVQIALQPAPYAIFTGSGNSYTAETNTFNGATFSNLENQAISYYLSLDVQQQTGADGELISSTYELVERPIPGFPHSNPGGS